MSMFRKIIVVIAALVALFAVIGLLLPRHSHVERTIVISAPRATVFALVDGYKQFNKWSPWAALDPNMKVERQGPDFGVGAKQTWSGNPKTVGSGSQEVVEIKPLELVKSRLEFGGQPPASAAFVLAADGSGTRVTWTLDTDNGIRPIGRYFGLLLDRFVGPDYEKGLASLKRLAESLPKDDFGDLSVALVDAKPVTVAFVEAQSSKDTKEIGQAIGAAYAKVGVFMKANGLKEAGWPITIDTRWDDATYGFDAAIPIDKAPDKEVAADSPVKVKSTYGGKALEVISKGPYSEMPRTYAKLKAYMAARGYESAAPPWDEYASDPGTTPEAELITNIYQPVK